MTVRIAFAGFDHWYNAFPSLEQVMQDDEAELVAIAHNDAEQAGYIAAKYGIPCGTSYEAVIQRDDVDVVCCFSSTEQNADVATQALEAGKAVVAIKPLALTLAEADALVATVQRTGRPYFPNDMARRLSPANRQFREWIVAGRIGDVLSAHCVFRAGLPQAWPGAIDPGWFADPARAPGGAFIDHAVYHIDVLRWLFSTDVQETGVQEVAGMTANVRHKQIPFEDYGHGVFRFTNGAVGTIEDTWTSNPGASREAIEIVGSKGSLIMDSATGKMTINGDFGLNGWMMAAPPAPKGGFMRHVVRCMAGDEEPISTAQTARDNLAACLAFYEAARTGTTVSVAAPGNAP
jgi:predicted dehydrogenase